ncbi:MFS transporter [Termitidicoccus mucosus]|uniref:MFS transporter n=1 Tax=Termitidicoccus mucosus TaxID=1184151 RepID=A0A178IM32_9BACT|nr:MFS transporter [Opitutaceae bacterium TSB47]
MSNAPAAPQCPPPPARPARKTWTAGALTYTTGGVAALFLWLLWGDLAWAMRDRSVMPMAQWYLNSLGIPSAVYALLISSVPAAIALVAGPVISVKSDRHRGRRGRRIPFLLALTPLAAFGMLGIALTPFLADEAARVFAPGHPAGGWLRAALDGSVAGSVLQDRQVVAIACFGVFWVAYELAVIAAQLVFGGLINDVVPRALLGRFYGLFRAISLIDGMIFNFWIIGHVPAHFTLIMVVIGLFHLVVVMWTFLKIREGAYPPPPPPRPVGAGRAGRFLAGAGDYFRECFTNSYYVLIFVMMMAAMMAFSPVNVYAIPHAQSLGVDMHVYGKFLALTFLISLGLSYFLGWLADVFHPLRVTIASLAAYALVAGWGGIFARTAETFLVAWVAHGVLAGCYFTSAASLGQRLYPHSKYAQFASAAGIFLAMANMVLMPLVGLLIDGTGRTYRHTFTVACALALVSLAAAWGVHRKFTRLGGAAGYVAPE